MSNSEVRPWWLVVARPVGFLLVALGTVGFFATIGQWGEAPGATNFFGIVGGPLIVLAGYHGGTAGATGRPRPRPLVRVLVFLVLPIAVGALLALVASR